MSGERLERLEAQDHCGQSQRLGDLQEFAEGKERMAAFRFGQVSASNATCCPHCKLRLTKAAALAQATEQDADRASKLPLVVHRTRIEQSTDFKIQVSEAKRAMASDTSAIPGVLACVASPANNCFAITNRGEKLSRHGFPLTVRWARLSE